MEPDKKPDQGGPPRNPTEILEEQLADQKYYHKATAKAQHEIVALLREGNTQTALLLDKIKARVGCLLFMVATLLIIRSLIIIYLYMDKHFQFDYVIRNMFFLTND